MCTVHGATFDNTGKATSSVTSTALRTYPVTQAGNILTVTL
jgi:nitrite reductase/ring-hydroxylating ferredoxin subunit